MDNQNVEIRVVEATFENKLAFSEHTVKEFYSLLRNHLQSFNKVNERMSKQFDSYRIGRELVAKIKFSGKTLSLYLALDPNEFDVKKYHHKDVSDKKSLSETPLQMKIKSGLASRKAIELISILMEKKEVAKSKIFQSIDFTQIYVPEPNTMLPLPKAKDNDDDENDIITPTIVSVVEDEVKEDVVEEVTPVIEEVCECIEKCVDSVDASKCVKEVKINTSRRVCAVVNVDSLCANFDENSEVTVLKLLEKGLIPKNANTVKLLGRGNLCKTLNVKLNGYSKAAITKIIAKGGQIL